MFIHWRRWFLMAVIVLALTACGGEEDNSVGSEPTPTPTVVTLAGASVQTQGQQPVQPSASTSTSTESAPTVQPADAESASLPGLDAGLENLESYRIRATIDFVGTDSQGESEQWQASFLEEVQRSLGVRHLQITSTEADDAPTQLYVVGETLYQPDTEDGRPVCNAITGALVSQSVSLARPTTFLFGLEVQSFDDMTLVARGENINGVVADHYRIDQVGGIGGMGEIAMQGDAWVAQSGGYAVKFQGSWSGVAGSMVEQEGVGTLRMDYAVEAVNSLPAIELPAECRQIDTQAPYPMPGNAQNEMVMQGMVIFTTPDSPEVVAAFYRDAMPAAGWSLESEQNVGIGPTLSYRRGDQRATVTITPQDAGASVMITGQ